MIIAVVLVLVVLMIGALVMAGTFLIKDKGTRSRVAWALTARASIAALVIAVIIIAILTGAVRPQAPWDSTFVPLQDVDEQEQHHPDDVNEVPIP